MMLHVTGYRYPGNAFAQLPNTIDFCFAIDAVCYEFKAKVFFKGGYTLASTIVTPFRDQGSTGKSRFWEGGNDDREK